MLSGEALARRLYDLFGPVAIELQDQEDTELEVSLSRLGMPCVSIGHGDVRFVKLGYGESVPEIVSIGRRRRLWAFYCNDSCAVSRADLDELCIDRGLQRAPMMATAAPYDTLDVKGPWWSIYRERVPTDSLTSGCLSSLRNEVWDFLASYRYASRFVREGDRVLALTHDADVRELLEATTFAETVTAAAAVSAQPGGIYDIAIDIENVDVTISPIADAMEPGAVVLTTQPGRWVAAGLFSETSVFQKTSKPRGFNSSEGEVELSILRKSVLTEVNRPFRNAADMVGGRDIRGIDFERHYVFPHIIRSLVNMTYRIADREVLTSKCREVLAAVQPHTADAGAALCVLSYALKAERFAIHDDRIGDYLTLETTNPHVVRWQISLAFIRGESFMEAGGFDEALRAFKICIDKDATAFHLSIMTKQVAACVKAANIHAARGNGELAAESLRHGTMLPRVIGNIPHGEIFGTVDDPRYFYYGEISEVLLLAGRCAYALEMWHRAGIEGLRKGLAISLHLFNRPAAPAAPPAVQRTATSGAEVREHLLQEMSMLAFVRFVSGTTFEKIRRRIRKMF